MILLNKVILFDGECNFCNFWIRFIIDRDHKQQFLFTSLKSAYANHWKAKHNIVWEDSVYLIIGEQIYNRSDAVIHIAKELGGMWTLLSLARIIPRYIRDWLYDLIAKHRYQWFGKNQQCMLPTPELQKRFLP